MSGTLSPGWVPGETVTLETQGLSLISFHRILIAVAILFCASYGVYELTVFAESEEMGSLLLAGFFMVVTIGLSYYLWHLKRFLGVKD